jgi:hypothetical protein
VSALFLHFVAESFVFAVMWHNKSPRSEREHGSEKPDPAVLFTRNSANVRKPALYVEARTTAWHGLSVNQNAMTNRVNEINKNAR